MEKLVVIDSEISGSGDIGIRGFHAKLINSTLRANAVGADMGGSLRLIDSIVSDNIGPGADAGDSSFHSVPESKSAKVIVTRSTITRNGDGLWIHGAGMESTGPIRLLTRP